MRGTTNVPSCYVILRKGETVLFVLRSNTGYMDGYYGLPAGHVENMENFSTASVRETLEEVGVKINPSKLVLMHIMHRNCGDHVRVDAFFEINEWDGAPKNAEPDKHSEIAWLELDNLPPNIMDYTLAALEHIKQGNTYSEYGWNN